MKLSFKKLSQSPAPLRVGFFLLTLGIIWLPVALPIHWTVKDTNLATILTMSALFFEFIFLLRWWNRTVYDQAHPFAGYGLQGSRRNGLELLTGLTVGVSLTLGLFFTEGLLGWLTWQTPALPLSRLMAEGLLSALGIAFAEEFLFRGWLLNELERDYHSRIALWVNALMFAIAHFLKPIAEMIRNFPAFPGLTLLGLSLVLARRGSQERLGLSIGLHAGLVWGYYLIDVGKWVKFTQQVPDWITGVDRNPVAGIMGLILLTLLTVILQRRVTHQNLNR